MEEGCQGILQGGEMNLIESIDRLLEKIQLPPRINYSGGLERYADLQIKKFRELEQKMRQGKKAQDRIEFTSFRLFSDLYTELGIELDRNGLEQGAERAEKTVLDFEQLKSTPEGWMVDGLISTLDWALDRTSRSYMMDTAKEAVDKRDQIEEWLQDAVDAFPEYSDVVQEFPALLDGLEAFIDFRDRAEDQLAKWQELQRHRQRGYQPETERVETLYHATTDAKTLLRTGFSEKGAGGVGLGGADPELVSFTTDLFVAKEIARVLKEAIMVARGKVSASDILDWAKREGGEVYDAVMNEIEVERPKRRFDIKKGWIDEPTKEELGKWFRKPETVFRLYNRYLYGQRSRYNPVFGETGPDVVRRLAKKRQRDVGVLECSVNMDEVKEGVRRRVEKGNKYPPNFIAYRGSEREYRVPVEAIISCDRIIK